MWTRECPHTAIGTGLANLIQEHSPETWDAIGGTTAGVVERVQNAANQISNSDGTMRGIYEHNSDSMFGYPVSAGGDPYGDWDNSCDMGADAGDGCFN